MNNSVHKMSARYKPPIHKRPHSVFYTCGVCSAVSFTSVDSRLQGSMRCAELKKRETHLDILEFSVEL
jgi:hypothetical protein